jgi:deoxyribonuclease V
VSCPATHRSQTFDGLSPAAAIALQDSCAREVVRADQLGTVRHVCGVDVCYAEGTACAAAALLSFPQMELREHAVARTRISFPYVPGLLSFREIPAALAALERLAVAPDLLLCDAHGIAHPRRFGLASHLGLLAGLPSIGVAKTRLVGEHLEPATDRGAWVPLVDGGERIGAVLRTRAAVRPVYVSIGHRVSLETAIDHVDGVHHQVPPAGASALGAPPRRHAVIRCSSLPYGCAPIRCAPWADTARSPSRLTAPAPDGTRIRAGCRARARYRNGDGGPSWRDANASSCTTGRRSRVAASSCVCCSRTPARATSTSHAGRTQMTGSTG